MLMGRLTRDPELKYTQNNVAVCKFTLAVNRRFAKQGEEKKADFINIVAWNKSAEFCSKYFSKGQQVVVIGRIQVSTWDGEDGKRQYFTDVVAEETYFAGGKSERSGDAKEPTQGNSEGFYPIDEDDETLPF